MAHVMEQIPRIPSQPHRSSAGVAVEKRKTRYIRADAADLAKAESVLATPIRRLKKNRLCTVSSSMARPGRYLSGLRLWIADTVSLFHWLPHTSLSHAHALMLISKWAAISRDSDSKTNYNKKNDLHVKILSSLIESQKPDPRFLFSKNGILHLSRKSTSTEFFGELSRNFLDCVTIYGTSWETDYKATGERRTAGSVTRKADSDASFVKDTFVDV